MKRRSFLKNTGYIAIGFNLFPQFAWMASEKTYAAINDSAVSDWLQVLENGLIKILTGKMELGQGLKLAIAQIAAEELNTSPDLIQVKIAETGITPDEGYTAGSNSIAQSGMAVRKAAATASGILLQKASEKFEIPKNRLYIRNGKIFSMDKNLEKSFFEILEGQQIRGMIPKNVPVKPKKDHTIVGTPVLRDDILDMVRAKPVYVQDLRFQAMVHARIIRPLAYSAKLISCNPQKTKDQAGVLNVVQIKNFIGVIAEDEFQAEKAQRTLAKNCEWEIGESLPDKEINPEFLKSLPSKSEKVEEKGSLNLQNSHKATYFKPYLMHASTGPSCAVAKFEKNKLQVWTHSQGVYPLREALVDLLELPRENIHVTGVPGSGCYGHNGADDVAAEAALLAREIPGKHVRLQWTRQEENAWEPYGSAMVMEFEASLDNNGRINSWKYDLWSDTHSTRPGGKKENLLPTAFYEGTTKIGLEGYLGGGYRNSNPYYPIANKQIDAHFFQGPLRVSALRSLGAYANIFGIESFMDELAEKAGADPVEFRLTHLEDQRAKDVIIKVRQMTSEAKVSENEGLGFAFSRYKNSAAYFAVAVRVGLTGKGEIAIKNMWGVIDSGEIINPDGLKNQTEGGMIQAASWTMKEKVTFDTTHITSTDWFTYPVFRFADIPEVKVEVIDRPTKAALGAGEAAQGPTAAAIVNAIYKATGKRIRNLPVNNHFS